jgi:CxxC motif-containing protein (DUF1111 family)
LALRNFDVVLKELFMKSTHSRIAQLLCYVLLFVITNLYAQSDPGPRGGTPGAGGPLPGLSVSELARFNQFREAFIGTETVPDGLGPRFNLDSCMGCHSHPAVGGTSPPVNPQFAAATRGGARNQIPSFLTINGPAREARRIRAPNGAPDGGVAALFTISGRVDAQGCNIAQPDFSNLSNFIFRIPTPLFGLGLMESIPDQVLRANLQRDPTRRRTAGVGGRLGTAPSAGQLNTNDNDGTVTRFGWKAQNKSTLLFSAEAYNVEMGVTNEIFPSERESACHYNGTPEDHMNFDSGAAGDIVAFAAFMRMLDQPTPAPQTTSTINGRKVFDQIGCALCHTPSFTTGVSSLPALSNKPVNLFSDLALHHMGVGLADQIAQGNATGDEFRTAPLWGLGQRLFFLHDGRTNNLVQAIQAHASNGSEANSTIQTFNALPPAQKQDLLNFLRSL